MHGIARIQQDSAGGPIIGGGQTFVRVQGTFWAVLHDPVQGHGPAPHGGPIMAEASGFIRINGIPVCREGHKATCGHPTTGSPAMRISS